MPSLKSRLDRAEAILASLPAAEDPAFRALSPEGRAVVTEAVLAGALAEHERLTAAGVDASARITYHGSEPGQREGARRLNAGRCEPHPAVARAGERAGSEALSLVRRFGPDEARRRLEILAPRAADVPAYPPTPAASPADVFLDALMRAVVETGIDITHRTGGVILGPDPADVIRRHAPALRLALASSGFADRVAELIGRCHVPHHAGQIQQIVEFLRKRFPR